MADSELPSQILPAFAGGPSIEAFDELQRILTVETNLVKPTKSDHRPWLTILALGDLACGIHSGNEDIKCVIFGNIRKRLFREIIWERIIEAQTNDATLKPYTVSEEQVVVEFRGIIFNIEYIESRELVNAYPRVFDVPIEFQLNLPDEVNHAINNLRDLERFRLYSQKISYFSTLHQFIIEWSRAVGLVGLGALNHTALRELSWMVAVEVGAQLTEIPSTNMEIDLARILRPFLNTHARCFEPSQLDSERTCHLESRLSITDNYCKTLHEEFAKLGVGLDYADPAVFLDSLQSQYVTEFLTQEHNIRISALYSGNSEIDGYNSLGLVDEEFLKLIHSLENAQDRLQGLHFRVWPTRLVQASNLTANKQSSPHEGFWIIGVGGRLNERKKDTIQQILAAWERGIHVLQRFPTSLMTVFVVLDLGLSPANLQVDTRQWQRPIVEPDPSLRLEGAAYELHHRVSIENRSDPAPRMGDMKKLRPAMDVLSRLRWDLRFNVDDYVVVYRDRHGGMLEKPVKDWATDTTAADWIPQDRIWYFKRLSDGTMVWDRAAKKDFINQ